MPPSSKTPSQSHSPSAKSPGAPKKPSFTPAPLDNISSSAYLAIWDSYVVAILEGAHSFHGADPASVKSGASYAASLADSMMEERQKRAQGHIDQK